MAACSAATRSTSSGGEWVAEVLESSDRAESLTSLEVIRGLDFDVIVSAISAGGQAFYDLVDREQPPERIDAIIQTVGGKAPPAPGRRLAMATRRCSRRQR